MRHATTITSILLRPRLLTCPRAHSGQKGAAVAGVNNCPERELKARQVDRDDLLLLIDYSMPLSPDEKECIRLGQKVCGAPSPPPLTLTLTVRVSPALTLDPDPNPNPRPNPSPDPDTTNPNPNPIPNP